MADLARITQVIEPEAAALGFELVRVRLSGSGDERTLQIMAEDPATGQLVVEQCMQLSRRISAKLRAVHALVRSGGVRLRHPPPSGLDQWM